MVYWEQMSPDEASKVIGDLGSRKQHAFEALLPPARAAVNVLKDQGQHSTARDLEAALFTIDTIEGEMTEAIRQDPKAFIQAIARNLL